MEEVDQREMYKGSYFLLTQVMLHAQFPRGPANNTPQDTCVCLHTIKLPHNIISMFVSNLRYINLDKVNNLTVGPKLTLVDEAGTFYVYALDSFNQVFHLKTKLKIQISNILTDIKFLLEFFGVFGVE